MKNVTLIGIDIGKHSFHIHCQDNAGRMVLRKKFTRAKLFEFLAGCFSATVVMEACSGSQYMARRIADLGHDAKLISPQFVRPFVKSNKNDFIDAEAICEAASRPSMRFVLPKTESQQMMSALHRLRESMVADKVKTANQMHGFLLEFGVSLPKGEAVIKRLSSVLADNLLPEQLVRLLLMLHEHYDYLLTQIHALDKKLEDCLLQDENASHLQSIPCIGLITTSLLSCELGDGKQYENGRNFAASLGIVPRQYSTGGKNVLMGISKRGNKNLRRLLVQCARIFMIRLNNQQGRLADWVRELLTRRHSNVVACALANKLARIAWAVSYHKQPYAQF